MDEYEPIAKIWISGKPPLIRMRARLAWGEAMEYPHVFKTRSHARRIMEAFATAGQIATDDWNPVYYQPPKYKLPETDFSYTRNVSGKYVVPVAAGVETHGAVAELHLALPCIPDADIFDDPRAELAEHFPRIVKHAPRRHQRMSRLEEINLLHIVRAEKTDIFIPTGALVNND